MKAMKPLRKLAWLLAQLGASGCELGRDVSNVTGPTSCRDCEEQQDVLIEGIRRELASEASGPVPLAAAEAGERIRATADGELLRTRVQATPPVLEGIAGSRCGERNAQGMLLVCQAGTFCSREAEGAHAFCVPAPAAPHWEQ